jgi:hypothetical protein
MSQPFSSRCDMLLNEKVCKARRHRSLSNWGRTVLELRPMALAVHSEKVPLGSVWYRHGRPSGSNPADIATQHPASRRHQPPAGRQPV